MKIIRKISEDEMISIFLKAEIDSDRFKSKLLSLMRKVKIDRGVVENPNISDSGENRQRKNLLGEYRGYARNEHMFYSFPSDIRWYRANLTKSELSKVQYINWGYWVGATDDTRSPRNLVDKIKTKKLPEDDEIKRFKKVARAIKGGAKMPEMIIVGENKNSKLVVIEGHVRLTSYFLVPEMIRDETEVIIGFSKKIRNWGMYSKSAFKNTRKT